MSMVREYLTAEVKIRRQLGVPDAEYASVAELVLREGVNYRPEEYDFDLWRFHGEPRECFKNALVLVNTAPDELVYVEGFACHQSRMVVPHAWAIRLSTLAVVDPTWKGDGSEYLGIPFLLDVVEEITDERESYGVLDDWQRNWPLLAKPLDRSLLVPAALAT